MLANAAQLFANCEPAWSPLIEATEWDGSRNAVDPDAARFDEAFRFVAYNISTAPRINSTAFLDDEDHRVMVSKIPGVAELWIYFRIESDDNACTLLWIQARGGAIPYRVG